jgi:hypothetical protein
MKASPHSGKFPIFSETHAGSPSARYSKKAASKENDMPDLTLEERVTDTTRKFTRALIKRPVTGAGLHLEIADEHEANRQIKLDVRDIPNQNHSRFDADFEAVSYMALSARAQPPMNTVDSSNIIVSGTVGLIAPMVPQNYIYTLGSTPVSMKFSEETSIPKIPELPGYSFVLEDESATSSDIPTDTVPVAPFTYAMNDLAWTRRWDKQNSIDTVTELSALAVGSHAGAMQSVVHIGDNATSGGRQPDGLIVRSDVVEIDATAGYSNSMLAEVETNLFNAGANLNRIGAMMAPDVYQQLSDSVIQAGAGITTVGRSSASPTGFVLRGGSLDGIAAGIDKTMTAGSMVIGDYSQLTILINTTLDIMILRQGAKYGQNGDGAMYAFSDFDVVFRNIAAFNRIVNI